MSDSQESDPKKPDPESSGPEEGTGSSREDRKQEAFDRAAEGLDLELERPSSGHDGGDGSLTGTEYWMGFYSHHQIDCELMPSPPPVGAEDDAAITAVIHGYESLAPAELVENWEQYATHPFMVVTDGWVATIDQKVLRHWLRSDELQRILAEYPPFSPRHVQISDLQIVYLGKVRAVVTYRLQEEFTNGKVAAANGSASLFKLEGGLWRIVIVHEQNREMVAP